MKVNIFKKLIREVIREELDFKFAALEKKLDEVLVSSNSNSLVEDRAPQRTASPTGKNPVSNTKVPMTTNSILNDILKETANAGEWKNIDKEVEVKSVVDDTQNLPDHLANAFTKDYSDIMKKAEEKSNFNKGPSNGA